MNVTDHQSRQTGVKPTIVLVHGAYADASSWSSVIELLQQQGYTVIAPVRACPVDHGTGCRSQIRIEATSTVPRQTKSRLSYLVATARCWRSLQKARSTTLRCLYAAGSKAGGRPPALPRRCRLRAWSAGSGMVALIPRLRR
jgi:pimeloyl-ACP methyl ester carboxylesterase